MILCTSNIMTSRCTLSAALLLLAIIGIISFQDVGSEITSEQMKYYFQTVLSHATYDKRIRPNQAGDPVRVKVSLYVIRLFDLDPDSESVKVSMYFRQAWQDERLSHNSEGVMVGGGELSDLIWKPDTMFSTSSQGSREETTLPNTFVRISPNGSVFHSVRLTQNINCQHQVRSFPMDSLSCKLQIESCELMSPVTKTHKQTFYFHSNRRLECK